MRLRTVAAAACVAALAACAHGDVGSTHADPWTAFAQPTPTPVRTLAPRLLSAGTYATSAAPRRLTFDLAADAVWTGVRETADGFALRLSKSADEVTKPVDGNDAWHLTWRVTKPVRVVAGGLPLAFRTGELDHAIVVAAPTAPLLVLMSAPDRPSFDTVYEEGHTVVFSMRIGR